MLTSLPQELIEIIVRHLDTTSIISIYEVWPELAWTINHNKDNMRQSDPITNEDNKLWFHYDIPDGILKAAYRPLVILDAISYCCYHSRLDILQYLKDMGRLNILDPNLDNQITLIINGCGWIIMLANNYENKQMATLKALDILGFTMSDKRLLAAYHTNWITKYSNIATLEWVVNNYGVKIRDIPREKITLLLDISSVSVGPWYSPSHTARFKELYKKMA